MDQRLRDSIHDLIRPLVLVSSTLLADLLPVGKCGPLPRLQATTYGHIPARYENPSSRSTTFEALKIDGSERESQSVESLFCSLLPGLRKVISPTFE